MNPSTSAVGRVNERICEARARGAALEIRGGGTKRFYGNAPRGEVLDLCELSGITSYEPTELVITALAGTPLAELEAALAERGQCLPFEPPRFAAGGTLGGAVAAGLSGPARASMGPLRDFVLGISLLNGTGETLTFGGQVMKNVAGYDVSRLLAGSMGILGVIGEVSLKVMPVPAADRTLCFEMDQAPALERLNRWAGEALPLKASAWYRGTVHLRLTGARAAVAGVPRLAGGREIDPEAADTWWTGVRDHRHRFFVFSDAELERGECLWRLSVRDTAPPLALAGDELIEWGGAQRWLRASAPALQVRAVAAEAGGHATLFRAADKSAGAFTAPTPALMAIHRRLKQVFDPAGLFNPGRLYPEL